MRRRTIGTSYLGPALGVFRRSLSISFVTMRTRLSALLFLLSLNLGHNWDCVGRKGLDKFLHRWRENAAIAVHYSEGTCEAFAI